MRTLDEQKAPHDTRLGRLRRDARLLRRLASMAYEYFTRGARVRRAYRKMERRGEIYWVDGA